MEGLNKAMYADEDFMRYPINTEKATLESYADACREGRESLPMVAAKFEKAAAYYGIALERPKIEKNGPKTFKIASEDGEFELTCIDDVDNLAKTAVFLIDKRNSMPRKDLKKVASYVLGRCDALGCDMDVPEMRKIAHIAGVGVGDRAEIEAEFDKRASMNALGRANSDFWAYSRDLKSLSDAEFYKTANLETVCNVLEDIDRHYGNTWRYGKDLQAPEDVVFKSTANDLLKEASDYMLIPSVDATLSKSALMERASDVNGFFAKYFDMQEPLAGQDLIDKVASLDRNTAETLLSILENA